MTFAKFVILIFVTTSSFVIEKSLCQNNNKNELELTDGITESLGVSHERSKRQQDPGDQFFDNIFQIPISTLNAVNDLIKSTRPVIQRARERIQQQYNAWQQQQDSSQKPSAPRPRPLRRTTPSVR